MRRRNPRRRRRLVNLAAALSLVLCVAMVGLWVRSYWRRDQASLTVLRWVTVVRADGTSKRFATYHSVIAVSGRGGVMLQYRWGPDDDWSMTGQRPQPQRLTVYAFSSDRPIYPRADDFLPDRVSRQGQKYGFGFSYVFFASLHRVQVVFPHLVLGVLSLILPAMTTRRRVREWRLRRAGRCPACGYDLRATPERCPECGAVPDVRKGAAA